jgi:hypothetical protein
MAFGLNETRLRRRRRRQMAVAKWVMILVALFAAGYYAYQTGTVLAQAEVGDLRGEISSLTQSVGALRQERDTLAAELDAVRRREAELQAKYQHDVPAGPARELFGLLQERLKSGTPPDRLAFVIGATTPERKCDGAAESKRFIVRTPGSEPGNDWVGFANNTIRVTAEGEPAKSGGQEQAWFDPGKPIVVRFTRHDGVVSEVKGILPISHSVVKDGKDYRFSVAGGPRGFVVVTGDRCNFP